MEVQSTERRPGYFESFRKQLCRTKEKFRQNMGRVDKTKDDALEHYIDHFGFQQRGLDKVHSDLKTYAYCSQATDLALNRLIDTILNIYDDAWVDKDKMISTMQNLRSSHETYNKKLHDDILTSVKVYLEEMSKLKNKISSMDRKLVDYDYARHSYESIAGDEKSDSNKESKAKNQLQEAWENLEPIHSDLMKEVPSVYDSRILFYSSNLKKLFNTEMAYHNETTSLYSSLAQMMDTLAHEYNKGTYDLTRRSTELIPHTSIASQVVSRKQSLSEHPAII